MTENKRELVMYQSEDGKNHVQVRLEDGNAWLTQQQIAELFESSKQNISLHIQNIYEDGELLRGATVKYYLTVRREGTREVQRELEHYNLDMILAVGYRVRSPRGVQFRRWASEKLKEFITKGFVLDDERLKGNDALAEQSERERHERQREERKTPVQPSQVARAKQRAANPGITFSESYDKDSYRKAILHAIRRGNKTLPLEQQLPHWTPYQIRHAAATHTEKTEGLDAAQSLLGHTSANMTKRYAHGQEAIQKRLALKQTNPFAE